MCLLWNVKWIYFSELRAAEVCLELNLKNGYSFHEKTGGPVVLNEDQQAL